jgi:diadenosine tetraphosphatase ApaH/serine/threonine PP2A family protein phosphatase
MRYAIISDVHNRRQKLETVLADAEARRAHQIISLGDVGGNDCLSLLRRVRARAVFGNYEVSGWRRLAPEHQAWVQSWPPLLVEDSFLAVHAAPWWPEGLHTVADFAEWLKRTRQPWRSLFPYLSENMDYVWQALAELETADKAILFHGHTHQQAIQEWSPSGRLCRVRVPAIELQADHRYVVGVGSVGLPEDGEWASYALYDTGAGRIELIRLDRPSRWAREHRSHVERTPGDTVPGPQIRSRED